MSRTTESKFFFLLFLIFSFFEFFFFYFFDFSFLFFFWIFPFSIFFGFSFFDFFWIFSFLFFGFFIFLSGLTLYCQSVSFSSGLTLYCQSNSFSSFHLDLLSIASQTHSHLFIWTYSLLPVKLIFIFLSGLTLYRQSISLSSFHLDLLSIASQTHFYLFIWTYSLSPVNLLFILFFFYLSLDLPLIASSCHPFFFTYLNLPPSASLLGFETFWKSLILTKLSSFVRRSFWSFYRMRDPLSLCIPVSDE